MTHAAGFLIQQPVEAVPLDSIDSERPLYPLSFEPDLGFLTASLKACGLLNPVVLRKTDFGFRIITGYRRVLAARVLGWSDISSRIFSPKADSNETDFSLAFYDNYGTRGFNLIEASLAVNGFFEHTRYDEAHIQGTILPLLGFQPERIILQQLRELRNLIHVWKVLTIERNVALPHASLISTYDPDDQKLLYSHLAPLKLGHTTLRHCLEMMREICLREKLPLKKLLGSEPFAVLRTSERLNAVQKTENFRRLLKKRRYPQFTQVEQTYLDERRKLALPPVIQVHPPDFFEGNQLTVVFKFRSRQELQAILESLRSAGENEAMQKMLDML